ncbi:MAG: HugZ family protein [Acidimicrobiia bacterium]
MTTATGNHVVPEGAGEPVAPLGPVAPARRPAPAEAARTLVHGADRAALATIAVEPAGYPFGSVAPYGVLADGSTVLCISSLAEHTRNLEVDARASLLVTEPRPTGDPMDNGRLTLLGPARKLVDPGEIGRAREAFLARNPDGSGYVDYRDFAFWCLTPETIRWVGGFGRMAWCTVEAYRAAEVDPTAPAASGAVAHLNADHADALTAAARAFTGHPDATGAHAIRVDRYGIDLVVATPRGTGLGRVAFEPRVETADGLRAAAVSLTRRARQSLA